MAEQMLKGRRALDLTDEKGLVCGSYLASLGVDVIKVEPPTGDTARSRRPFHTNEFGDTTSLYWKAFNAGKRGVTLDLLEPQGQEIFKRLATEVDFLIESFPPGFLDSRGCGVTDLQKLNPKLVVVSITAFGQSGPYSTLVGDDLVAAAMSGVLGDTGDEDRAPVRESGDSIYFQAGLAGALGAVMAHYHCLKGGTGQQVDVSLQECGAIRSQGLIAAWQFDQRLRRRHGSETTMGPVKSRWIWACSDGHLFWHMLGGLFGAPANKALATWMDEVVDDSPLREISDWNAFDKAGQTQEQWDRFEHAIGEFFRRFTKAEIQRESLRRGVNACPANDPAELLAYEQLTARGYWQVIEDPEVGPMHYPGYFFLSDRASASLLRPAPTLGEHNSIVYCEELGLSPDEYEALRSANVV